MSQSKLLRPPTGYESWLAYAVDQMPTRDLYIDNCFDPDIHGWPAETQRADFRAAAEYELELLGRLVAALENHVRDGDGWAIVRCTLAELHRSGVRIRPKRRGDPGTRTRNREP